MRRGWSGDRGNLHTLEAVIVASIMVSVVTFVVTFEAPPKGSAPTRALLQDQADDALAILYDTPIEGNNFGDNALSVYIGECLQKRCENLTSKLQKLLPSGASYAIYISNGYSTYPVLVTKEPTGEAVTSTQMLEPRWSNSFIANATNVTSPSQPLLVYTLPIYNSNVISEGGSPLFIRVQGTRVSDGSDYVLTAYHSTTAYAVADAAKYPAVSLYFVDEAGKPIASRDVRSPSGGAPSGNVTFTIRAQESAGVTLRAGTELVIHIPRGWTATANQTWNLPHWLVLENATSPHNDHVGADVKARLLTDLTSGVADFRFNATYVGDRVDYYPFHARLSRGALSAADIILRANSSNQGNPSLATPTVVASVPRPMGATATTTWTLATFLPNNDTFLSADNQAAGGDNRSTAVDIHTIEIIEQDGAEIFGEVTGLNTAGGTWTGLRDRLVWSGNVRVSYHRPLNLTFEVKASGIPGASDVRNPFTPPVAFDGWTGRLVTQSAPGLFRGTFLPADENYRGYGAQMTDLISNPYPLHTPAIYRTTPLPGNAQYAVGQASAVAESLYGSYVNVERRNVPLGGEVVLTSNVQSVLFTLSQLGHQAGVTLRFYPPWSGDSRVPIFTQENLDRGLLMGDVVQVVTIDLNGDGFPDPVIGTSNGRVIAYNGLTGVRLQGSVYTAPIRNQNSGGSSITQLAALERDGTPYIVVGTGSNSKGVIVLDKNLDVQWEFEADKRSVVRLDTSVDMNGDGRNDIIAALSDAVVYVLEPASGTKLLKPIRPAKPLLDFENAFYKSTGTPSALVGLESVGPYGAGPGFGVTVQTLVDGGINLYWDVSKVPPKVSYEPVPLTLPRAGLQIVNHLGEKTSTLFGSPVTLARPYDYDEDGVTDVLSGGSAGYVFMSNGRALTQPLYSYVLTGGQAIIDADTISQVDVYALTADGQILYTDDQWQTIYCASCESLPNVAAVSAPGINVVWAVGPKGTIYRSVEDPTPQAVPTPNYLKGILMKPFAAELVVARGADKYSFLDHVHDLYDIQFLRGDLVGHGWIIGSICPLVCDESLIMGTKDGGETWEVYSTEHPDPDYGIRSLDGGKITSKLNKIYVDATGTGWIIGEGGIVLRNLHDGQGWVQIDVGEMQAHNVRDISCISNMTIQLQGPCVIVGEKGVVAWTMDALSGSPEWLISEIPEAGERDLYSIGIFNLTTAYVGSFNRILKTTDAGASWTTMPLNYIENSAYEIDVNPDGSGYIFGGSEANGRIWVLQDYATQSSVTTKSLSSRLALPDPGAVITQVDLVHSNASIGYGEVRVNVSANDGKNWQTMGILTPPDVLEDPLADPRNYTLGSVSIAQAQSGQDLRFQFLLNISGDKTITSPFVRDLTFNVTYRMPDNKLHIKTLEIDFHDEGEVEPGGSAVWNAEIGTLHMPFVSEYWTRNVSGEVLDLQTGYDVTGDWRSDVWVATGDILALNSPDYVIYAGSDENRVINPDNRVYLLDGATGRIVHSTLSFEGEVTHLRLGNRDGAGKPEALFATTWNEALQKGELHALDPATLAKIWSRPLHTENALDMELGGFPGPFTSLVVGTANTSADSVGRLWSFNETDGRANWRAVTHDQGRYDVKTKIPDNWFFGPYVVEIEVDWKESVRVNNQDVAKNVVRSARFYDYFVVTAPDALKKPPTPIYDVHLVTWFDDWQ